MHMRGSGSIKPNVLRIFKGNSELLPHFRNDRDGEDGLSLRFCNCLLICVSFRCPRDADTWPRCGQLWSREIYLVVHLLDVQTHVPPAKQTAVRAGLGQLPAAWPQALEHTRSFVSSKSQQLSL